MDECVNKIYIEEKARYLSREDAERDVRAGCLKCSGFNYQCVDRIGTEEVRTRNIRISEITL